MQISQRQIECATRIILNRISSPPPLGTAGGPFSSAHQESKNTSWSFFEAVSNWSPAITKVTFTLEAPCETISTSSLPVPLPTCFCVKVLEATRTSTFSSYSLSVSCHCQRLCNLGFTSDHTKNRTSPSDTPRIQGTFMFISCPAAKAREIMCRQNSFICPSRHVHRNARIWLNQLRESANRFLVNA